MSQIINDTFKLSCISTDKKLGSWWAIGTKNYYLEIRITNGGKIRVWPVQKGKHPYFTIQPSKPIGE